MRETLRKRTTMPGGYKVPAYNYDSEHTEAEDHRLRPQFVEQFNGMLHGEGGAARLVQVEGRLSRRLSELNKDGKLFNRLAGAATRIPAELTAEVVGVIIWLGMEVEEGWWNNLLNRKARNEAKRIICTDEYGSASRRRNQLQYFFDALSQGASAEAHYVEWRLRVLRKLLDRNDETAGTTRFEYDRERQSIVCTPMRSQQQGQPQTPVNPFENTTKAYDHVQRIIKAYHVGIESRRPMEEIKHLKRELGDKAGNAMRAARRIIDKSEHDYERRNLFSFVTTLQEIVAEDLEGS